MSDDPNLAAFLIDLNERYEAAVALLRECRDFFDNDTDLELAENVRAFLSEQESQ